MEVGGDELSLSVWANGFFGFFGTGGGGPFVFALCSNIWSMGYMSKLRDPPSAQRPAIFAMTSKSGLM